MEYFDTQPEEKLKNYYDFTKGYMNFEGIEAPEEVEPPKIQATTAGFLPAYLEKQKDSLLKYLSQPTKKVEKLEIDDDLDYSMVDTQAMIAARNKQSETPQWITDPNGIVAKRTAAQRRALDFKSFENDIRRKESEDKPWADNPNSSAVGYYQFLWGSWGKDITRVTGVKTSEEFKRKPELQKKYFKYYYDKYVVPAVSRVKNSVGSGGLGDYDIAQLVHFRGEGGAKKVLRNGELHKKQEGYNPTAMQYINN